MKNLGRALLAAAALAAGARGAELKISPGITLPVPGGVGYVAFSNDGRWLAVASYDKSLAVFDTTAGSSKIRIKDGAAFKKSEVSLAKGESVDASKQLLMPLAVSLDGNWVAGAWGDTVFLWDLRDGKRKVLWRGPRVPNDGLFGKTGSSIRDATFSGDGKFLAIGRSDLTYQTSVAGVIETATGRERYLQVDPPGTDENHHRQSPARAFSPDGKLLAVVEEPANGYNGVGLWSTDSLAKLRFLNLGNACGKASFVSFSPDGATLVQTNAGYGEPSCTVLWDVATGMKKAVLKSDLRGDHLSAWFSKDGAYLTVSADEGDYPSHQGRGIALWDARTYALLASIAAPPHALTTPGGEFVYHTEDKAVVLERLSGAIPAPTAPARLSAQISLRVPSGDNMLDADETGALVVTVANAGPGTAYSLSLAASAQTPVPGLVLPAAIAAGDLAPGRTVVKEIPLRAAHSIASQEATVRVDVKEGNGFDAAPRRIEFRTRAFLAPKLELTDVSLAGSGIVKADDVTRLSLTVRNSGEGPAHAVSAALNLGDPDIFPSGDTKADVGDLAPGASRTLVFQFFVNSRFKGKTLPVSLSLTESAGSYGFKDRSLGLAVGEAPEPAVVDVKAVAQAPAPRPEGGDDADVDVPPASKLPVDAEAYAVVVGIERYRQQGIPAVDFATRDAQTIRSYLTRSMGFDPKNVVLLLNEDATKTDLEKYLGPWLKNRVTADSRVFVYYAGHGAPNPQSGEGYLIPYEGDPSYTDVTAFPIKRLYADLAALPARQVFVALDACFSGQGGRSVIAAGARPLVSVRDESSAIGRNTVVLAATGGSQISTFYPDGRHGLMTYYLLKGLKGAADLKHDGTVTTAELFAYLKPNVERAARELNVEQSPTLNPDLQSIGDRGGDVWVRLK